MDNILDALIERGVGFNFENNSRQAERGVFSKVSDEFLAWVAGVEHFLILNYDKESGPFKLFETLDRNSFSGDTQSSFEKQLQILRGVLLSCKDIAPNKKKRQTDNLILSLIKNPIFWTATAILIGGAFTLGFYLGNAKFDNNLIELSHDKIALQDSIRKKNDLIQEIRHNSDSALNILGHMPYDEMRLDTLEFRKVQTTIENAGGALYLNK